MEMFQNNHHSEINGASFLCFTEDELILSESAKNAEMTEVCVIYSWSGNVAMLL